MCSALAFLTHATSTLALPSQIRRPKRSRLLTHATPPVQLAHVFSIVITERGGSQRQLDFDDAELTIGRLDGNDVVLPRGNVSKRHARVLLKEGRYVLLDLQSTNGTFVNARRVNAPTPLSAGDKILIGDFMLTLREAHLDERDDVELRNDSHDGGAAAVAHHAGEVAVSAPRAGGTLGDSASGGRRYAPTTRIDLSAAGGGLTRSGLPQPWALKSAAGRTLAPAQHSPVMPPAARSASKGSANDLSAALQSAAAIRASSDATPAQVATRHDPRNGPGHFTGQSAGPPAPAFDSTAELPVPIHADAAAMGPIGTDEAMISGEWPAPNRTRNAGTPGVLEGEEGGPAILPSVLVPSPRLEGAFQLLMERLAGHMDLSNPLEQSLSAEHQLVLERLLDELAREGVIEPETDRRFLMQAAISEAAGLGPLDRLLNNRSVRQVIVDGPTRILADLGGGLLQVSSFFSSPDALLVALWRLCARAGRGLDDEPLQELWMADGSLIQVMLPPFSARGPLLNVRRAPKHSLSLYQLVTEGLLSNEILDLLVRAIRLRLNVLVVGAPGSGVSTLLSALAGMAEEHERIVSLEDVPSLSIRHPHVLQLRPSQAGTRTFSDLLHRVARLHADRLVMDDLTPDNLLAALPSLSGMRGVFAGMHLQAPSAADAARQLETFAFGHACPTTGPLISAAFQLRLQVDIDSRGVRRLLGVTEIRSTDSGELDLARLYRYHGGFQRGRDASFLEPPEPAVEQHDDESRYGQARLEQTQERR